jgi:6,7-dimethyl-8-ribityllumazine synthase
MVQVLHGALRGRGHKVGIAVARFNEIVTERLLEGALQTLRQHGVADDDIVVTWVPGAASPMAPCGSASSSRCRSASAC